MNQLLIDLSPSQLRHAADLKEKIDGLHHELSQILGAYTQPGSKLPAQKKHRMSAAARARIAAGA